MKAKSRFALLVLLILNLAHMCKAAPAKWAVADGGNDHSYLAIALEDPISWKDANSKCIEL